MFLVFSKYAFINNEIIHDNIKQEYKILIVYHFFLQINIVDKQNTPEEFKQIIAR